MVDPNSGKSAGCVKPVLYSGETGLDLVIHNLCIKDSRVLFTSFSVGLFDVCSFCRGRPLCVQTDAVPRLVPLPTRSRVAPNHARLSTFILTTRKGSVLDLGLAFKDSFQEIQKEETAAQKFVGGGGARAGADFGGGGFRAPWICL